MPEPKSDRPLVLVADRNAQTAALIGRRLEWAGYDFVTASSGTQALAVAAAQRPQAAAIEVMIEGASGYDVVRELRADPRNRRMPLLLMSRRAGRLDRDFAFTVGADEYFRKPFVADDLVSKLVEMLPPAKDAKEGSDASPLQRRPLRRHHHAPAAWRTPALA